MALNKRQYTDGQTIITAANLNEIQDCIIALEGNYVPKTRTVAGKALSSNITLAASDVGAVPTSRTINSKALSSNITLSAADVGAVPVSRTVNSKALSSNITLNYADVGAVPSTRTVNGKALSDNISITASDIGAVPTSRTINSKALTSNITLSASDVSAVPTTRTVNSKALSSDITLSASDVGAVPTTRTINSKALSSDITLAAADIGYNSTNVGAELDSLNGAINSITPFDTTPTSGSSKGITSGAVATAFDMLKVSGVEAYYSLSDVASYLSDFSMGYMAIVRIASTAASVFFEAGTAKPTLCFFLKASSTNAYFLATTQDNISIGNLNVTTSTITVLKDLATNGDVQNLFNNLYVSFSTPYNSLSDLTTYLSTKSTGSLIIARVTSSLAASFFESGSTLYAATCFIYKASSTNAYFFAYTRDDVSIGNIGISTSTITSVKDLAIADNSLGLNSSISYPAYLTTGIWRTGNDGTINLQFPCTSLKESNSYTTTSTISINLFKPGSADAAIQLLNKSIAATNRITTDNIILQIAAENDVPINRMGFFSTRTIMTITAD